MTDEIPTTETVTGATAAAPAPALAETEPTPPTKESLIAKIEAELEAIPHELVAKIKAAFADLKVHL